MTRFPDWPERLAAWVERQLDQPFAWGTNDCVSAAASAVEAMTGTDPLDGLRWSGRVEAGRALEAAGGLFAATCSRLGQPIAPVIAQRGDLVLVDGLETAECGCETLAVCLGGACVAPGRAGLMRIPMSAAKHAWGVGRG